jgi:DNA-binding NtrC family response regulator
VRCLEQHGWPGNVRELQNVVERAIVMGDGETIWPEDLPPAIRERASSHDVIPSLEAVERDHIIPMITLLNLSAACSSCEIVSTVTYSGTTSPMRAPL